MANVNVLSDYADCILEGKKIAPPKRRCNSLYLRIPFRISRIAILIAIASILFCQFAESLAEQQTSSSHSSHDGQHVDKRRCLDRRGNARRSLVPVGRRSLQSVEDPAVVASRDIPPRLEAAATLRKNLVTALGRVLLLCLDDDARVPLEVVHDAVRNRRVAVYDLLLVLPALRDKLPKQQLYKLLQMLERVENRFVAEYASLCINVFDDDVGAVVERARLADLLSNVEPATIESMHRKGRGSLSLTRDVDSLLRAARNDIRTLNSRVVSAILLNHPSFDHTDPEILGAVEFVARRLRERSGDSSMLLRNVEPYLENASDLLRTVLERLELDESSSRATQEAASLLLQNYGAGSYPPAPKWKNDPRRLLTIAGNYYPVDVTAVATYLADRLDDSHFRDLDIGFYEMTDDRALLQILSRLRGKSSLQHLGKPLSMLTSFVAQKLGYDDNYIYTAAITQYEVNNYLDSFDIPCLRRNTSDAIKALRSSLTRDLPWTYAFGDKRASDDPRELTLLSLTRLRNIPLDKSQAIAIDNFVYKSRVDGLTGKRNPLYDSGVIFQRGDSTNVEVDLFSLLMRIPNAFRSEKFAPMLNFLSKPNIFDILGYEFNKFEHETPRSLLLAVLKRTLTLASVKSDESLFEALQDARNYLEEPLLINLYTSEDLQLLLEHLPSIESDPRYLPLKILFKKKNLFMHLSANFNLAGVHTPMERLLLILRTISLKIAEPSLFEALSFALDNIDGPPLKIRTFGRVDFVYLTQQLLSRNSTLQDEILKLPVYENAGDWNVSISGTPENVLARVLSYPVKYVASNGHLSDLVKRAVSILEKEEDPFDIGILKKRTLEAMLDCLPNNTYTKPVILLLRKANLMTLVPKLNLTLLEDADPCNALIAMLSNLIESRVIRAEKLLLRRVRAALSSLDGNSYPRQNSIYAYLIQLLQDPSKVVYKPLLREISKLRDVKILSDERQSWLQNYMEDIVARNETKGLTVAASMALKEIEYDGNSNEETRAGKARIVEALSYLPIDSYAKPLHKLLTSDWTYTILPEELKNSDSLEKEKLLLAILHHAKRRTDVADNLALTKIISNVEAKLNGWKVKIELLKSAVAGAKAAIYEPVRNLLTAAGLNKMKVLVPPGKSVKISLLGLLHQLLQHPLIKQHDSVFELLSAVRQDVLSFGMDVDPLTVLDDAGIAYSNELAPVRLFLHKRDFDEKITRTIFKIADPAKRYRALRDILWKQRRMNNDTRFHDAVSVLRNIEPVIGESDSSTRVSDLNDIVNSIPHHIRQQFKSIEGLFNVDLLARFTRDNEIVESKTPLIALLSKLADLSEVRDNRTAMRELKRLRFKIEQLGDRLIVTGYQLRPLLLELGHVQQINVDYLNSIIDPEVLSYLNPEEFSDPSDDDGEVLSAIVDYLLYEETMHVDYNMRKHLQSLKRALVLTMSPGKTFSQRHLSKVDWEKILVLIPSNRDFTPIKILLQSEEIYKYVPKDMNWKLFPTPVKKLLHLLSLIEDSDVENKNVHKSANKLRDNLEKRFNFVTEQDVKSMHSALASLKLKYDLAPLKIFLNHENMIKYLPPDFKYAKYGASINGFAAALDILLRSPSLKQTKTLHAAMIFVRESIRERTSSRRSSQRTSRKRQSREDLEFVRHISVPKLREFLKPEKLLNLLPQSFTLDNRPTFKTKALHLLRQLLHLNITDVHVELEKLVHEVETYPDVPDITQDDLTPLLNILPVEGIPHVELIKRYLRPLILIKLLPGNINIRQAPNAKVALRNVLSLLSMTLGSAKNEKLKVALDALSNELAKISSNVIPEEALIDSNDVKSIIEEIPFKRYKQIEPLEAQMKIANVMSALPTNFELTRYKTKKRRTLALLDQLSKSKAFKPWHHSVNFAKRIVSRMPSAPAVNDTEIERLILPLPLSSFYVKQLATNCKLAALMPYLPIHFNLANLESRKAKITEILRYCKVANPTNMSTRQALTNIEGTLKSSPDFDVTMEHVRVLIRAIPCARFTLIKPLLRLLSVTNIASLLPWDLDVYRLSRTFKSRVLDLLAALRNVKELQSTEMFTALDYLEINANTLPDRVGVPQERVTVLGATDIVSSESCAAYRNFVLNPENLVQILPPTYRFQTDPSTVHNEWAVIAYMSSLFLRDVKIDGAIKDAFKVCVEDARRFDKQQLLDHINAGLNGMPYDQFVPLRLYTLGHANALTAPIEDAYRGFLQGTIYTTIRVAMTELIRRPELIGSKSVIDDMEVFLHDYVMSRLKEHQETPTSYDVDLAVGEIPNEREYDDLRELLRCQEIQVPVVGRHLSADHTPKRLLADLLNVTKEADVDERIRKSVEILEPSVARWIREEEVEYVLKQLHDYRHHANKLQAIRRYLSQVGLQTILMNETNGDLLATYPTYKQRLDALNERLLAGTPGQPNDGGEFQAEVRYLNRTLHNETRFERAIPRTIDDVDVESLFLALPKTRNERIIRGAIKFFSVPGLLRRLNLPKDPFAYATKGRLLQAIMDLGQELESVQEDPVQQEALGYFGDRIEVAAGPGSQPIDLRKSARDVDVDTYGVMRAVDYARANVSDAVDVAAFLDRERDRLAGFDHAAYATRGAYLKALFERLVDVSQVPDDVKRRIETLMSTVRLDGPGEGSVDLNVEVVASGAKIGSESLGAIPEARFGTDIASRDFRENEDSLKAAIDHMLGTITSSEEEYLAQITGRDNTFEDKTRVLIGAPEHKHDARRRGKFNLSLSGRESTTTRGAANGIGTKASIANRARARKRNDRSKGSFLDGTAFKSSIERKKKPVRKVGNKSKDNSNNFENLRGADSTIKSRKGMVKSRPSYLSGKPSRKSRDQKYDDESTSRRILPLSDTGTDIEYDVFDESASIPRSRMLRDMLKDKELVKELMAEMASSNEKRRSVKKDLSRHTRREKQRKRKEKHEMRKAKTKFQE